MTLGGLALSVGVLVDQAIVTIENIERHLHMGTGLTDAIVVGAGEIGVPAFVSTVCICIVFVPMFFLSGVARFLFVPMAEAVVFAMAASYLLSRTFVPTMVMLLMRGQPVHLPGQHIDHPSLLQRLNRAFDARFEQVRRSYTLALSVLLSHRRNFTVGFMVFCVLSCGLFLVLGRDFFPSVDSGQIRLHLRLPTGTRIEERPRARPTRSRPRSANSCPPTSSRRCSTTSACPTPASTSRTAMPARSARSTGEIQMSLKEGHQPTDRFVTILRRELPRRFPGIEFFFQPADIVTQILNFGPAGRDRRAVHRQQRRRQCRAGGAADPADRAHPGRGRRARAPAPGRAVAQPRHGSHQAAAGRPERAERRPERADLAVGQLADVARLLAQTR